MQKVVFLDRDGTINIDYGYVHTSDKFVVIEGAEEAMRIFVEAGYKLIVISNQSGIGRGYFSEDEYLSFQSYIECYFKEKGIKIEASYYCPHIGKDNCNCRKPKTGLFYKAAAEHDIDWNESIAIGDRYRDLAICDEKGVRGFFIRGTEPENINDNVTSVDSLLEVAMMVKNDN